MDAAVRMRRFGGALRDWALWTTSPALACWLTGVTCVAGLLAVAGLATTAGHLGQAACFVVLTGCGAVCVEAVRREGEPAGVAKDLLSAWTLPVALLLPPVYSLLIPVPLTVLLQLRVRRGLVHRRVYSAAVIGLANWVVSVAFHRYLGWNAGGHLLGGGAADRTTILLGAVGIAVIGCAVNVLLIGVAVRLASPETGWRELAGTASSVCWTLSRSAWG